MKALGWILLGYVLAHIQMLVHGHRMLKRKLERERRAIMDTYR